GVAKILSPWIPVALPEPGLRPVWLGLVTGFICLLSFAMPPLLRLRGIEPVRVIRRDLGEAGTAHRLSYIVAVAGTIGLMWWYSGDLYLTSLIFSGAVVAVIFLGIVAWAMLQGGRALGMQAGSVWRLALSGMQRRGRENTLQIMAFGLAIMLLLILYLVRTALIGEWQAQIPPKAPNHFAINISPKDVAPIRDLLEQGGIQSQPMYPMIRGRIESINGAAIRERDSERAEDGKTSDESRGPRAGSGRNLTFSSTLPEDNRIVAGKWWPADYHGVPLVSIERDFARGSGIHVGDKLVFSIEGADLDATVASLRSVAWDNLRPNFFIVFSPGALDDFPSTWMTSFYLPPNHKLFLNRLLRQYPTMTVIEVDALIAQIKTIIAQVTSAIQLVLVLILVSGALVLLASLQASMDERFRQQAILRTLGASRRLVLGSLLIEFCVLGCFAGVLATLGAEVTVYALEHEIFELPWHWNPELWLIGPVVGTVLIGFIGTMATRKVVSTPPIAVLREL
ncbi:MAG TPA: FtsX-like permease family protein, partial [Pseudomonadales bacterium]|nr:FtsX-like permease family protein [Pseudomonadales bacterium]